MSRKSKAEYIGEKRRAYACASAAKRRQILDEVCETLCYTRKYVIKLIGLRGSLPSPIFSRQPRITRAP